MRLLTRVPSWLLALTLLRLVAAAAVPLSPDEAYYRLWSMALAPGFLDHPPMVALFIRAGIAMVGDTPLGVRLLAPFAALAGSLLLIDAVDRTTPGRGETAAMLLNATLLFGAGAIVMTPDTPLLLFWTAALWALARLDEAWDRRWWLAAGAATGLALVSKYTAFLLFPATFLWLLAARPRELRRWHPWAALALAFVIFSPVIAWNAAHHWVSFEKQGGRLFDFEPVRAAQFLGELAAGQVGLATPLVALLLVRGEVQAWRARAMLPLALTLVPAAVFLVHALGDRVQGNWPAVIYPAAALATALNPIPARRLAQAIGLGMGITLLVYVQAATGLVPIPARLDPTARQLRGWEDMANSLPKADFLAADNYGVAAELALFRPRVFGAEPRWALFTLPRAQPQGTGLLLAQNPPDPALWRSAEPIGEVRRTDRGVVLATYHLYRVTAREALSLLTPETTREAP
jgi:4-amino-4-deoxy-L-arabinose transferase-like glycosyltransferase